MAPEPAQTAGTRRDARPCVAPRLPLLSRGLDIRAVTEQLFISRHTVQDHLKSLFGKFGVHSRGELLATFGATAQRT